MSNPTFAECFCAKYNVPREKYARAVFRRTLYRRTFVMGWLLPLVHPNYFAADFDLIYGVENLRRARDFATEVERFNEHPANHGWLRRAFCLRVSTSRLKALIRETLPAKTRDTRSGLPGEDASAVPFEMSATRGV
jgi:hypothetical protein